MDAKEQAVEVNRLRQAIYNGLQAEGGFTNPRELNLALLAIVVQVLRSRNVCDKHIKESVADMVEWLLDNTTVVMNKDIN